MALYYYKKDYLKLTLTSCMFTHKCEGVTIMDRKLIYGAGNPGISYRSCLVYNDERITQY